MRSYSPAPRAFAPANQRMSPSSRTSSGETAWMVMKLRSSATRKALGSCETNGDAHCGNGGGAGAGCCYQAR